MSEHKEHTPEKIFSSRRFEIDHVLDDVIEIDESGRHLIVGRDVKERLEVDLE